MSKHDAVDRVLRANPNVKLISVSPEVFASAMPTILFLSGTESAKLYPRARSFMKLVRLTYASRLSAPLAKSQLQKLHGASGRHNASVGITGYLCVSPQYVLQCLEGPRDVVNALYNRIVADDRHCEVTVMRYTEPWRRLFPGWHMGFSNELSTAAPESSRWRDASGFNPYLVDSDLIENVIEELCERSERIELRA